MKTRNLYKQSMFIIMMAALAGGLKGGESMPQVGASGFIGGGSGIYIPRHGKLKGWMKENKRSTFNKTK
jgi:hypothetical protein